MQWQNNIVQNNVKVKWHTATCCDPYSESRLCIFTHPKCTHTAVNTHTHTRWTHTRSSGQPFMLQRPGSSWVFGALLKGTSVVVLRVESAGHSLPHLQFLPAQESNSQHLDYKSDSLIIRPQLSRLWPTKMRHPCSTISSVINVLDSKSLKCKLLLDSLFDWNTKNWLWKCRFTVFIFIHSRINKVCSNNVEYYCLKHLLLHNVCCLTYKK